MHVSIFMVALDSHVMLFGILILVEGPSIGALYVFACTLFMDRLI
jgi:hypothetical protein